MSRLAALVLCVLPAMLAAQQAAPAFEVASVKRTLSEIPFQTLRVQAGGGFVATYQTVVRLIAFANSVDDFRVVNGPGWIRDVRFDVNAKAAGEMTNAQARLMMQSLLADRFRLATHREQREMAVYSMVLARDDGRLGPGLQLVDDCKNAPLSRPGQYSGCGAPSGPASLAAMMLGAPVVDKTGLTGTFSFVLSFNAEGVRPFAGEAPAPGDQSLPSFRDALREQLGLKLESGRGPVEVLVIDSVEQPTPN